MSEAVVDPAVSDPPQAWDVLYRSERTVVARRRARAPADRAIRKQLLGPGALARLRHEARMLERLLGLPGVSQLVATGPGTGLLLRDIGGSPLTGAAPLGPARLVGLARDLARTLAGVHRRGLLHLDISPANIVQADPDSPPELIDFHLATLAAEEHRGFTHHSEIAGTLAYLAPELTGRMGHAVDHRADLYALGATLYELATGAPPFGHGDALQLIRDHVATVPIAPTRLAATVPPLLSKIILRLLEKAPDRRYQSAEGLADDLDRLHATLARGEPAEFALGASDFPLHLAAPSRPVGRAPEMAALRAAFGDALEGGCRGLLISGAAGVGKTALIDQLHPIVSARGGWLVAGKFEQYRRDGASDAVSQVMRGIAALLLAEPEAALAAVRARLRARLGADAGLLLAMIPEMAALVGATAPPPGEIEARSRVAVLGFLAAIVTPARPLVMVLDDLQWAPDSSLQMMCDVLSAEGLAGLLVVGAHRDPGPDPAHPLNKSLQRWHRAGSAVRRLELGNLPSAALAKLLSEMLRLPPAAAVRLAEAVGARTDGNPFETVELLNGLRRDKVLTRGPEGWQWDSAAIRRHVGQGEVSDLLEARIRSLPAATRTILANMACLGSDVAPGLLAQASPANGDGFDELVSPALEDGLLVLDQGGARGHARLRFRNHRVQEAVVAGMDEAARQARHLALARRLAGLGDYALEAAEQYLPAAAGITDPRERRAAATLMAGAAASAARLFRHASAERFLAAAILLLEQLDAPDGNELKRLRTDRLTALYNLGAYDEGDRLFAMIGQPDGDPLPLAEASCVQVVSLSNRGRHREAMAIGLVMLEHLGISRPAEISPAAITEGLAGVYAWVVADAAVADAERRRTDDPLLRAAARLITRMLPSAQLLHPPTGAWLALENHRLWATHGVCPEVVANLARSAGAANVFSGNYRTGYAMARHAVTVGAALGFEPHTSYARQNFATFALHYFEPIENALVQVEAARQGLIRAGEVQAVCINYIASLGALFDCAATLGHYAAEIDAARDYTARTGNDHVFQSFHSHQLVLRAMTGEIDASACLRDTPGPMVVGPLSLFSFHSSHALIAALLDDPARLAHCGAAAMPLCERVGFAYRSVQVRLLRALSLAQDARAAAPDAAGALPAELAALRDWFAQRAIDAPSNFEHLRHFVDAEAAWTMRDVAAATRAFDRALQACAIQTRPWQHALIAERAGRFHLAHGLDYLGRALLRDAQARYAAWGAVAVVRRLTAEHGFLETIDSRHAVATDGQTVNISSDTIDLLGILRASQALSSQTTVSALHARVVETLAAMTGATTVLLIVWDDLQQTWCLPAQGDAAPEPMEEAAAARRAVPLSALRYVERTRAPLVVDDAKLDDRFARDPYFADIERCSLMVLPVQSQGAMRAMLMLKNRLSRGVFSRARLDLVTLVASQLAVSLDNALLYASLERRVAERTEALAEANRRLEQLSISDALTGLANRRHFDNVLQSEWLRASRAGAAIGLVLVDIDHFKRYNDHYGHVGGDRCLRAVAAALQVSVRQDTDLAARYGGEEFALILPGADIHVAMQVAERAHAAVLGLREPHLASAFGCVTLSLGVASVVPGEDAGAERLIELADAALYRAKQQGRNRLVPATGG
jgi:diguanylate cyclase (GGDEF)-like protein